MTSLDEDINPPFFAIALATKFCIICLKNLNMLSFGIRAFIRYIRDFCILL